jgi:hypothetical protein
MAETILEACMRWSCIALITGSALGLFSAPAFAGGERKTNEGAWSDPSYVIHDYKTADPVLNQWSKTTPSAQCAPSDVVAFSAFVTFHASSGDPALLLYSDTYTNIGDGWDRSGTFIAPRSGLYFFSATIKEGDGVRDAYVLIAQNGAIKGVMVSKRISASSASYSITLLLNQGDYIQTFAASVDGDLRIMFGNSFTGFLVKAL